MAIQLKDFVAETLEQVQKAVNDAIVKHNTSGAVGKINPVFPTESGADFDWKAVVQDIKFDVSVTVTDGRVCVLKAGETSANRIKFVIPVVLPSQPIGSIKSRESTQGN